MTYTGLRIKRYVFDLDDTLFLTKDLVVKAYLRAGVVMPEDAWGKPAYEWLPQIAGRLWMNTHVSKNEIYTRILLASPPERTTAARAMVDLSLGGCETYVLTGASKAATNVLLSGFQPYHYRLLGTKCSLEEKTFRLRQIGDTRNTVYVDDDHHTCDVMEEFGCHVVRYTPSMTKEEVMEPWAQSSWLPDVVND